MINIAFSIPLALVAMTKTATVAVCEPVDKFRATLASVEPSSCRLRMLRYRILLQDRVSDAETISDESLQKPQSLYL